MKVTLSYTLSELEQAQSAQAEEPHSDFLMLDYRQINTENASLYDGYMEQFKDADKLYNDNIRDTLERFFTQQKTIKHTRPIFFMNDIRFNFKFIYSHKIF